MAHGVSPAALVSRGPLNSGGPMLAPPSRLLIPHALAAASKSREISFRLAQRTSVKPLVRASIATGETERASALEGGKGRVNGTWTWQRAGEPPVAINYVLYPPSAAGATPTSLVLFLPSFSDVSTVEEWDAVASDVAKETPADGEVRQVATVDWPGFGASDSSAREYTAAFMEEFLAAFVTHIGANKRLVLVGAGHAPVAALKAIKDGRLPGASGIAGLTVQSVVAVAPTWAGPLPIVFGHTDKMRPRYAIFRSLIRSPGLGWALYRFALTSPRNMRQQYLSHVYADADNVTQSLVDARAALTRRANGRFAPASFVSGLLDSVKTREEFVGLFGAAAEGGVKSFVVASKGCPRRSKAEMQALKGASGVSEYVEVDGALLPHEEYPKQVADALRAILNKLDV
eukprot:TRINITY_DN8124_c0_g1_i1.p1 TRINITY_DN8124_c0_g1~~TRINITY_DN8124_c0_g1_i1.p1  ORF type:complete len:431 (-),score=-12.94 TRINITY_DN8124_c0_g1_i1:167-1372(-)